MPVGRLRHLGGGIGSGLGTSGLRPVERAALAAAGQANRQDERNSNEDAQSASHGRAPLTLGPCRRSLCPFYLDPASFFKRFIHFLASRRTFAGAVPP